MKFAKSSSEVNLASKVTIFVAVILGALLAGHFALKPPTSLPDQMKLLIYEDGKVVRSEALSQDDRYLKDLESWIASHRSGWWIDLNSYAPGIELKSDEISVNLISSGSHLVVNFRRGGTWLQVSRRLQGDETDAIRRGLSS
jgi:hypothetical protein